MKGLIIKDSYTLAKQMKFFMLFIVIFALLPGFSFITFAIVYATMLPMTAIAYDERSKWDKLAAMMPYSAMDIVLSKYILGFLMVIATAAFSCFAQEIIGIFKHSSITVVFLAQLTLVVCFALIIEAIELPVLIKFGMEKGRMLMIIFMVVAAVGGASLIENTVSFAFGNLNLAIILPLAVLAAVGVNVLSVLISQALYKSKMD